MLWFLRFLCIWLGLWSFLLWLLFLLLIKHLKILLDERLGALNNFFVLVEGSTLGLYLGNVQNLGLNSAGATGFFMTLFLLIDAHKWLLLLLFRSSTWQFNDVVGWFSDLVVCLSESMRNWCRIYLRVQVIRLDLLNFTLKLLWSSLCYNFSYVRLFTQIFALLSKFHVAWFRSRGSICNFSYWFGSFIWFFGLNCALSLIYLFGLGNHLGLICFVWLIWLFDFINSHSICLGLKFTNWFEFKLNTGLIGDLSRFFLDKASFEELWKLVFLGFLLSNNLNDILFNIIFLALFFAMLMLLVHFWFLRGQHFEFATISSFLLFRLVSFFMCWFVSQSLFIGIPGSFLYLLMFFHCLTYITTKAISKFLLLFIFLRHRFVWVMMLFILFLRCRFLFSFFIFFMEAILYFFDWWLFLFNLSRLFLLNFSFGNLLLLLWLFIFLLRFSL